MQLKIVDPHHVMPIVEITRVSPRTGKMNTMKMMLSLDDLQKWQNGDALIQNAMPYLTADQREFLMTGLTSEDWENMFPCE